MRSADRRRRRRPDAQELEARCRAEREVCDLAYPAWTPDGPRIVATMNQGKIKTLPGGEDSIQQAAARALRPAKGHAARDPRAPQLDRRGRARRRSRPTASTILYNRYNSPRSKPAGGRCDVRTISLDGSNHHQVAPWELGSGDHPGFAPDGDVLLQATLRGATTASSRTSGPSRLERQAPAAADALRGRHDRPLRRRTRPTASGSPTPRTASAATGPTGLHHARRRNRQPPRHPRTRAVGQRARLEPRVLTSHPALVPRCTPGDQHHELPCYSNTSSSTTTPIAWWEPRTPSAMSHRDKRTNENGSGATPSSDDDQERSGRLLLFGKRSSPGAPLGAPARC